MTVWKKQRLQTEKKFETIYGQYGEYLYKIAYNSLNSSSDADDAMQECMIRIYKNIDKIASLPTDEKKKYISRIMKNVACNIKDKKYLHALVTKEMEKELYILDGKTPEEIFAQATICEEVNFYLNALNEMDKRILVLKYLEDKSSKEIADLFSTTDGALSESRLSGRKESWQKSS